MTNGKSLRAGQLLDLRFPELPNTLCGVFRGKEIQPRLLASLPRNYTPDARFPLLVYLTGGEGGEVTESEISYVRRLTEDQDFIAVTMPLFKKGLDSAEIFNGLLIGAYDDYPLIARCYQTMLKALFKAVPNLDPQRSLMGGFSNGAHTTALLLSCVDSFVLKHFAGFFLLDGGWHIASHHKLAIQRKRIVYFIGGSRRRKHRRCLLDRLDATHAMGKTLHVSVVKMPGIEHAFPDHYIPRLREWILDVPPAEKGSPGVSVKPRR